MYIDWCGLSDIGTVKVVNQDSILCDVCKTEKGNIGLFAVADGVGGLEYGEVASRIAIETLNEWWKSCNFSPNSAQVLSETLVRNIADINKAICDYPYNMATTLSLLMILEDKYYILHIGDSRVYHYKSGVFGVLEQLTPDHSSMILKVVNGEEFEKSVLTDCLGRKSKSGYYSASSSLDSEALFVLCSDGVYKMQSLKDIKKIISRNKSSVDNICNTLISQAKSNGETDNISAIVVKITDK